MCVCTCIYFFFKLPNQSIVQFPIRRFIFASSSECLDRNYYYIFAQISKIWREVFFFLYIFLFLYYYSEAATQFQSTNARIFRQICARLYQYWIFRWPLVDWPLSSAVLYMYTVFISIYMLYILFFCGISPKGI